MGDEKLQFDFEGAVLPSPVPLAHVPAFTLGPLRVEPALRKLSEASGRSETLEPLVLQLLITFRSALGHTLTRDDLIAACWAGRIVSDDAINRVVSKLRRVLADLGEGAVRLDTVTKVGYRLVVENAGESPATAGRSPTNVPWTRPLHRDTWRKTALAALGLVALGGMGSAAWGILSSARAAEEITIGVEPMAGNAANREDKEFASALTGDLAQMAGAISRASFVEKVGNETRKEDLIVRIAVERDGDQLVARPLLVDGSDGSVLWSDRFATNAGAPDRLREQVAMATAGVMRCGLERSAKVLGDAASIRLFFAACNAVMQRDPARGESLARQIVARRPDVAAGWACLALTTLQAGMVPGTPPQRLAAVRAETRRYALKALALDPHVGRAYEALALAAPQGSEEQFATVAKGIAAEPELPALHRVQSFALFNAGYVRASLAPAQRALALDPTSTIDFGNLQRRLMAVGRIEEARAMQIEAERIWPSEQWVTTDRLLLLRFNQDPREALAELDRVQAKLPARSSIPLLLRREVLARVDPASRDVAAIEREAAAAYAADPINAWTIAAALTRLGYPERALTWMERAPGGENYYQWSSLFTPDTAAIRRDPRFFATIGRLGLLKVWRARHQWPDFCSEPGLRYDCATEAARLERGVDGTVGSPGRTAAKQKSAVSRSV
ncbi:winged helix-turn-helix domain-containing protein [Novosphingobium tardum]|uniref:Winged helix-turn-helix domain-containing protein n=1 Tax=Novosphingobium tardum TaxID=1538021 RepID=A0ABV8RLA6_9SPHN